VSIQSKVLVHGDVIRVGEVDVQFADAKLLPDNLELLGEGASFNDTLCSMLESAKCFDKFPQTDIDILAKYMKAYRAPAGATVFYEGERNTCLWVLTEGSVNVCKQDSHGVTKQLSSIRAGKLFGEISVVDYFSYSASIVTEKESCFLIISRENFNRCVDDYPILGVRLLSLVANTLCARLRASSGQLASFLASAHDN
jgi:CRP-like cAMP-binding protein